MSTYDTLSASVESSRPVKLYEFRLGTEVFRYASGEDTISAGSAEWDPLPIRNAPVSEGPEARTASVQVFLPGSASFVQRYAAGDPSERATLQIFRLQRGDPATELRLLFKGVLSTVNWGKKTREATLEVLPLERGLRKRGPRLNYGAQCPHMLYDLNCKVLRASFQFSGTVATVSGAVITVTGLDSAHAPPWASAGEVVVPSTGERRLVKVHAATNQLTLIAPFDSSPLGETVDVFAGCDHTLATCEAKFANEENYGGWPFIPTKNPFETGIL